VRTTVTGAWALCEDAPDGRTIEALAVPYDTVTEVLGQREQVAAGSVDVRSLAARPLLWRHAEPVGVISSARDTPHGPVIRARISDTQLGNEALTLVRDGAVTGVSIGFEPLLWDTRDGLTTYTQIHIREVSLTPMPAYETARVTAVREEHRMSATTEPRLPTVAEATALFREVKLEPDQLRDALDAQRQLSSRVTALEDRGHGHPLARYRSLGEYAQAMAGGSETREWVNQITADNPGVVPPAWLRDIKGIVDNGRPLISALGGSRGLPESGMSLTWPYFDGNLKTLVGVQATEKTDITSAKVSIKSGSETIVTYAGGSDLSLQLIMRSDPSYVDAYIRIMLAAYGVVTDAAAGAKFLAAAGGEAVLPTTGLNIQKARAFIREANSKVLAATGSPATAWIVSPDVYALLADLAASAQAEYMVPQPTLLPVEDPNLADETNIVTNGVACGWHEVGPNVISDDVVSKLGRDYAVYGFAVGAAYLPAGIVKGVATATQGP
jgi:hypothetical protein